MESAVVTCAFCGAEEIPRKETKDLAVVYRCSVCGSVIAAYAKDAEEELKFGRLLKKYPLNHFKPTPATQGQSK